MYKKLREGFEEPLDGNILGISGIENFRPLISEKADVTDAQYPDVDMQNLPFEDDIFDFVISDQVIEHLENPKKAIEESYRVLKRGGIAIHTTCFINYIHLCPNDLWRFSPDGLRYLCNDFNEIIRCEGWGNRIAILLCFVSDRFRFINIPESKWSIRHLIATYCEDKYPIVTWVVAKK
jgi:ubiquinone/menaquinone biosynthesis C-methylase UbiE